ncbi:hypothetical protein SUGI_0698720 [Cryptomeria japonica]|uniref:uncharacterized protein LOC131056350 n=1 Tax=Cryptomeria japonica TaxID=3369 RepID=UPI0024147C06|nr:uncharacterized protein LOC131056350 [Cryptomeria japonica]GLJ34722.1 hypothetical protein SUGI_0698720 [Cryptomeria japonica]
MSVHPSCFQSVQGGIHHATAFPFDRLRKLSKWHKNTPISRIDHNGARYRRSYAIWNVGQSPSPLSASGFSSAESFKCKEPAYSIFERLLDEQSQLGIVLTATEIAEATGGQVIKAGPPGSICTDTRNIKPGQWFLALTGPRFDGHQFLQSALAKSCAGVVGNRVCENWPRGFVKVEENTLTALHKLGSSARKKFKGPVVGITGSTGKTTTRAMIALVLESLGHIHQTSGNQNNHIGVPLTLISMPMHSKACVLELGMNHSGEIQELARISEPCVRVVLNVGPAHMENFTSLEEIGRAKGEIFLEARSGDICILNADDPLVMALHLPDGVQRVLFGSKLGCDVRLIAAKSIQGGHAIQVTLEHCSSANVELEKDNLQHKKSVTESRDSEGVECCQQSNSRVVFEIPSPGQHLGMNACAAAAVAVSLGVSLTQVGKALSKFSPVNMRLSMETFENGITIINDTYNANPMSMVAALDILHSVECKGRKVALLGDMFELGISGKKAHADILKICQEIGIQLLGVAGLHFMEAVNVVDMASSELCTLSALNSESLALQIRKKLNKGDVVLVKGSRGMQMEIVVKAIKEI